jgi:hypothetical protein
LLLRTFGEGLLESKLGRWRNPKGLVTFGREAVSVIFGEIKFVGFFFGWVGLEETMCWEGACLRWEVRTPAENFPKEEEAVLKRFMTIGFEVSDIFF